MLQIQRNLATDGSTEEMQKVALLPDSKVKVGASLGYNVRTLLKDLGMEVRCSIRAFALCCHFAHVRTWLHRSHALECSCYIRQ